MYRKLSVPLLTVRWGVAAFGLSLLMIMGWSGSSKAQNSDRIIGQFLDMMKEAQRAAQRAKERHARPDPDEMNNVGVASTAYKVAGIELGQTIDLSSERLRGFSCEPSESYKGHTNCQQFKLMRETRGEYRLASTFLLSPEGRANYVNQSIAPAFWSIGEVEADIEKVSRTFREEPHILNMPPRETLPKGAIATWGKVLLEPLDGESLKQLAGGANLNKGFLVDFQNNFALSAKNGLPVYRLTGGAGYVWIGTVGPNGKGTLRFFAVDASALAPPIVSDARQTATLWNHNGSVMSLVATNASRRFSYEAPRSGMQDVGVVKGTILFNGQATGNVYEGTAHIFHRSCHPFPYRVSGSQLEEGRRIVLRGQAPTVDDNCRITGHVSDSLEFALVDSTTPTKVPDEREPAPPAKPTVCEDSQEQPRQKDIHETLPQSISDQIAPQYRELLQEGAAEDVLIFFNTSSSAPNLNKDLQGLLRFDRAEAVVCEAPRAQLKDMRYYIENRLRTLGILNLRNAREGCAAGQFNTKHDVHVTSRGCLGALAETGDVKFFGQLETAKIADFIVIRREEIVADQSARISLRRNVEQEVTDGTRLGFGFLGFPSEGRNICVATPSEDAAAHEFLIAQHTDALSTFVLTKLDFLNTVSTKDAAFIHAKRNDCRFIYADASSLRELATAFRRDDITYSFVESWSSNEEFANVKNAILLKKAKEDADRDAARKRDQNAEALRKAREEAEDTARQKTTALLRKQSEPRVRGLLTEFGEDLARLFEKAPNDAAQDSLAALYPTFANWYQSRRLAGWELEKKDVESVDFGHSDWKNRRLETIYLRLKITLINRDDGVHKPFCWVFSRVEDPEFKRYRDPVAMECDGSESQIAMRKQRTAFRSEWFAP